MRKKVVACLLAAIMTLGAVGCSSDTSTNTTSPKEESTEEAPAESESEESDEAGQPDHPYGSRRIGGRA